MEKRLYLDGESYTYELTRKRVKNINLRITSDGTISVSCPYRVPEREVENFLLSQKDFILNSLAKTRERISNSARPVTYSDGEKVNVYGERCTLHVSYSKGRASLSFEYPDIYVKASDETAVKRCYEKWRRENFQHKIYEMYEYYYPAFAAKGVEPVKDIAFRTMKSRWGVCVPDKRKVTFNYNLFEVPEELIAYVVVHELSHFIYGNHQAPFWKVVESVMPDYKQRRKALREY